MEMISIEQSRVEKDLAHFFSTVSENMTGLHKDKDYAFYADAVDLILYAESKGNRLHLTGIGKPGHIAGYLASLFSSTGTPAYFLDGTEAVHGSAGQVKPGDVVIAISNSGQTSELKYTVETLQRNGAKIIGVTGGRDSWLANNSDVFLYAAATEEGGPLNRAPRNSISVEVCVLQGLSIILQSIKNITPQQYVKWHPGGALGQIRKGE